MDFDLSKIKPDVRSLEEIKKVAYDKKWLKTAPDFELYYMYRGLEEKDELRYDITIIPSNMLGKEYVKTKGHEHIGKYQEVYIVLEGRAIYLLQKRNKDKIEDVLAIEAEKGDIVIIPSRYGHVTINPCFSDLKMANWVSKNCQSDYQPYEEKQGACYYFTKEGWIRNKNYSDVPTIRFEKPLKSLPENLDFLK